MRAGVVARHADEKSLVAAGQPVDLPVVRLVNDGDFASHGIAPAECLRKGAHAASGIGADVEQGHARLGERSDDAACVARNVGELGGVGAAAEAPV